MAWLAARVAPGDKVLNQMKRIVLLVLLLAAPACTRDATPPLLNDGQLAAAPFEKVRAAARGQPVRWFFWSGDGTINRYVDEYVVPQVAARFGVKLERIPVDDPALAINRLLSEQRSGQTRGQVDLIWINGENFRTGKQAGLFFGPFARSLPSARFLDEESPAVTTDFGVPTEGFESPWNRAQFVFIHDTAHVASPPLSIDALTEFIEQHPGRFTYPAPPDFTGSAFLRHVLYAVAGGPQALSGKLDETRWSRLSPKLFAKLKRWRPNLWRRGETYPESASRLHQLYAQGEVWLSMSYGPETASSRIREGVFPPTTRTFVLDTGTLANTNFVAIPFNSQHKAAAMVVADFLLSPEAQLQKQDPAVWGTLSVLDSKRLPPEWSARFAAQPRGPATLPVAVLNAHAVPELDPSWLERLESDWVRELTYAPR